MYYQISYDQTGSAQRIRATKIWIRYITIGVIAAAFCWAVLWSTGMDWGVTLDALEQMAINLKDGENLKEAFSGFCLDILEGAQCG